jgi:CDP-diacylglycerol--glycerol-3-phosphate 3-phosphatidyltransferase
MNLPNKLTVARCILTAIFVALMTITHAVAYFAAYLVFTAAAITDHYDGKIARRDGIITNFGKLMDPLADKVLVASAFLMLMTIPELRVPAWTIILILAREFLVTGARALAAGDGEIIGAMRSGKLKTIFQLVYVFTFLFFAMVFQALRDFPALEQMIPVGSAPYAAAIGWLSLTGILFVAVYTVYSGVDFARVNWKNLKLDNLS